MSVNFVSCGGSLVVGPMLTNGKTYPLAEDHPARKRILALLREGADEEDVIEVIEQEENLLDYVIGTDFAEGVCLVDDNGKVYFNGEEVHGTIVTRINEFIRDGLPIDNLLRFVERVKQNPSYRAQQELYDFLENKGLPVTDDGYFLAYKAVQSNYMDKYSGKIDNSPGQTVSMDRAKVDDERSRHCSKGLHCGALDYVYMYGGGDDHIIIVKVDPKDVVSVPNDCSCQKCRVCRYEVLRDFEGSLNRPLYTAQGEELDDYDDDMNWDFAKDDYEEYNDDYYEDGEVESLASIPY